MRNELQSVLESIRGLSPDQLPELLGELEVIRATALLRMSVPVHVSEHDELLDVEAASQRLGMSVDYLYRHSATFPFTRREGRQLRFSSQGIDAYIRRKAR